MSVWSRAFILWWRDAGPFRTSGRVARGPYCLGLAGVLVVLGLANSGLFGPLAAPLILGSFYALGGLLVRRFHDIGLSAWWAASPIWLLGLYAAVLIPSGILAYVTGIGAPFVDWLVHKGWALVGALLGALLMFAGAYPGTAGANRFGPSAGGTVPSGVRRA